MDEVGSAIANFITDWLDSFGIPVHHIREDCEDFSWMDDNLRESLLHEEDHEKRVIEKLLSMEERTLYFMQDIFLHNYSIFKMMDKKEWIVFGPVLFEEVSGSRFDSLFDMLKLPERLRIPLQNHYYSLKLVRMQESFENVIMQIANLHFGKENYRIERTQFASYTEWENQYKNVFQVSEEPFSNIQYIEERYSSENQLMQAVMNGNESLATMIISKADLIMLPKRLLNTLRDHLDYTITLNTILRKAAEQGGVHPIHIDSFSNHNIQLIEQITSVEECRKFLGNLVRGYCQLVQKHSLKGHPLTIRKALTYISTDLSADLSLNTLAEQLHVNASYLSSLFKKEMGISLTEYVTQNRIEYAKWLLVNTDLPMKTITVQCGFSDMNYFIRRFRKSTGVTPKVYRENNMHEIVQK